jgi:predicted hydrolase (HD superfamily)
VRPNKSITGLEVASVRKKMKSKGFAAGVNREDLVKGAAELGVDLDEHIALVILAVSSTRIEKGEMSQPAPHNSTGPFTGDTIQQITEEVK